MPAATVDAGLADALRARLAGGVIGPGDAAYECRGARSTRWPTRARAAIARCASRDDVVAALAVAAGRGLPLAVRAGGTSDRGAGDGALVLDLSPMDGIEVDAAARTARVGPGVRWAALDEATQRHGLAVTGARVSRLGVGGVALGDGSGWLERALGPTGASLAGAELVLADGRVLDVGEAEAPGLLWALRGAGARLGVVTRLDLRLHPVGPVLLCGLLGFPRDRRARSPRPTRATCARRRLRLAAGCCSAPAGAAPARSSSATPGPSRRGRRPSRRCARCGPLWTPWRRTTTAPSRRCGTRATRPARTCASAAGSSGSYRCRPGRGDRARGPAGRGALPRLPAAARRSARGRAPGELALRIPDVPWAYRCVGLCPPVPALDAGRRPGSTASPRHSRRTPSTRASRASRSPVPTASSAPTAPRARAAAGARPRPRRRPIVLTMSGRDGPSPTCRRRQARRATIAEVAALARVSRTTVSHALNGKGSGRRPRVSASSRRRERSTTGRAAPPGRSARAAPARSPS